MSNLTVNSTLSHLDSTFLLKDINGLKIPNRKSEHWKYNDVAFLTSSSFKAGKAPNDISDIVAQIKSHKLYDENANRLVFVNGELIDSLTNIVDKQKCQLNQISDSESNATIPNCNQEKNPLISWLDSATPNSYLLEIESDIALKKPIQIFHLAAKNIQDKFRESPEFINETALTMNKIIVDIGQNSKATISEFFLSSEDDNDSLALQKTIIFLRENVQCEHFRLNLEDAKHRQVSSVNHLLNTNSNLEAFYFSPGSLLNKTDINLFNIGTAANSLMNGIYLPTGDNTIDYHTNIEHQVAHCNSKEIFRGIIADSAKATFNGKIHIFENAQKSDAQLSNKNLLLTNTAEINTKPELEIYADDVLCAHGATVAKIDELATYYLETRGINKAKAKRMLSVGFINELLNDIKDSDYRERLSQIVLSYLSKVGSD